MQIFYLAHVRFENGEEFGLFRKRENADKYIIMRTAEIGTVILAEVLSLQVAESALGSQYS